MDWLRDLAQDVRYALRSLLRSPAFTATAVATVALGIGVNTAVFNVIANVLLEPLPYRDPGRLVHLAETHPSFPSYQVTAPDFFDWQKMTRSFDGLAAYTFREMNQLTISGDGDPEPVQMVQASSTLFPLLGVKPLIGRFYTEYEEHTKAPVAVLSESLWRRRYASDPSIIGRKILIVDFPVSVVGVIPDRQAQPNWAQLWTPLSGLDPALTSTRRFHTLEVIGRLKAGVSLEQAQAEMQKAAGALAGAYPVTNAKVGVSVEPMSLWTTSPARSALLISWAAAALVLLLACVNVAHLVLVRTVHRSREIAVRVALGSGAARMTRFLLAENFLVALAGAIAGALLACVLVPFLSRLGEADVPGLSATALSPTAVAFGAAATLLCAALFALPAVLHSRRLDLQQAIKQSSGVSLTHRRSWLGSVVIAAEIAIAFTVISGAALLYRSFGALLDEKTGFDSGGVLAMELPLALDWRMSAKVFHQKIEPRLREIPGVTSVAAANCAPMMLHGAERSRFTTRIGVAGQAVDPNNIPVAQLRWTTLDYFRTLRIPLKRGRLFTAADIGKPGYVINEALARRLFPNQNPVGRQLIANVGMPSQTAVPIVGVVGDVRDLGFNVEPAPTLYEINVSNRMTVLIRGDVNARSLVRPVRAAMRAVSPGTAIGKMGPLDQFIAESVARRRFALRLIEVFAALGVLLTAVGIYGVISYALSQRVREFAIRFALGAECGDVRRVVLHRFAVPTVAGLLVGSWLAVLFGYLSRAQLYRTSPADPLVFSIAATIILAVIAVAVLHPVLKACSISPVVALRE